MNAKNLLVTLFALVTTISNAQINPFVYYTFEGVATGQQWNSWTGTTPECTASCIPCPITPPGTLPNTSLIGEVGHYALLTTSNGQLRNNSVILNNINGYSFETLIRFDQGTGIQRRATLFSLTTSAGTYLNFYFDFDLTGGGSSIEFITDLDGNNGQQADNFSIELNGIDRKSMQYYMDNDWHHIAFSYNPITGEKKVWVDGVCPVEFTSFAINIGAITSSPPCTLFVNAAASNDRIVGGIDEIAYYDNVISNEEIAQHYLDFSGIHSHYTYQLTEPPSYNISLSSDVDPNEFPFGHAIGGGELSSANVSHSAIEQLHSYSLPRFKPGNLLHKNMNLVRSKLIGDNSSTILATKLQTSLDVQIELASNWNYYFNLAENISVEWNEINQSNTHPNKWMSWVDQNYIGLAQNFQYAAFTNRRQIRPSDYYPVGSSPYPTNFRNSLLRYNGFDGAPFNYPKQDVYFVNNNNFSFCNLNGTEIADQNNGVKFWVPSSIIANYVDDGNTTKLYLNPVLNRLNSIGKKLSFIAENNEASPTYNIDDDTDVDFIPEVFEDKPMEVACSTSVGHVCSTLEWKQYIGDRKIFVDNDSYRNVIINGDPLLNECNFLNYAVDGGPVDRYYWPKLRETQLFNTSGTNGIFKNAYSTMDFYPITPSRWKVQNVNLTVNDIGQVPRGWRWVARSRNVEISAGDKLMAPYVGAGWYPDEERNFRPGQWLGLMKCLGLTGVDFYHAYYDYGSGEPKGYIWQVAPPSYAQAILSRIDHIIVYGNVLPGDVYATPGTPSQGRAFAFNTGNPLHLVVVRQDSDLVAAAPIAKYAISGSIQKIINMIGDAPLEQNVKIDLKAGVGTPDFLQFNIRRQGNTYVLDRTRANSNDYAFYQLDKWHQWEHPERWSKDFDFEAEAFDNPTQTLENSIHTENASHSAITDGDYRNYTSYVSSSVNIYDYNFQPRVNAPFYLFIRARRNGGTATVSSININLYNTTTSSGFALKTIGCIDNGEWLWYMIDNVSGTGINYNLIANNNYRLSIQDLNNNVLIDRIYLGLTNAAPDNGIAVSSSLCPGPIQFNASVTPITCYGSLSGSITINANGGSGWYDFNVDGGSWITGVNASYTSPNLSAGTHTLQVRDQNNTTSVSQIFLATI